MTKLFGSWQRTGQRQNFGLRCLPKGCVQFAICMVVLVAHSALTSGQQELERADLSGVSRMEAKHLPNAIKVCNGLVSGGLPEGEMAFAELQSLGFKTIISVDGARPDVELAEKYGMTYVHLPHGYDGISTTRAQELAKALVDLPGPVYLHCHHGKHRSPTAAVVAAVGCGKMEPRMARKVLEFAGTSANYRGLYQAAESASKIPSDELKNLKATFKATADLPPMAEAMVLIDQQFNHLVEFQAGSWQPLKQKPDLVAEHEALLLREHYTELIRLADPQPYGPDFWEQMEQSRQRVAKLERMLGAGNTAIDDLNQQFRKIETDCKRCHREHRDIPLNEKPLQKTGR